MCADDPASNATPTPTTPAAAQSNDTRWTVMIFMGAATIQGNEPLLDAVEADLREIREVSDGVEANLNIFVQVHGRRINGKDAPQRYHFGQGQDGIPTDVPENERDCDDGQALAQFIEHATTKVRHRRKDHSLLVLWGHAYDFSFGRSLTQGGAIAALEFAEIGNVLQRLQRRMQELFKMRDTDPVEDLPTLDVIGFDACDVATAEMAYQLQPFAKFLLASQIGIPVPGWPYHRILDRLKNPHGDVMSPPEFGSYAVRRYCAAYDPSSPVSLTLLNLAGARHLARLTESFAVELAIAIGQPDTRDRVIDLFFESQTEPGKPAVDVADLCLNLATSKEHPELARTARELGDFVIATTHNVVGQSKSAEGWPFVAEHGCNSCELVRLNGLSLYAPHVAPSREPDVVRERYHEFAFARETRWSALVHNLVSQE
jgi:hypothetical protein